MFMTREANGPKILGGDVPELESYGGEVDEWDMVSTTIRTMGSPGSADTQT